MWQRFKQSTNRCFAAPCGVLKFDVERTPKNAKNVAQLCRHCCCPNKQTDNPLASYPLKTQKQMEELIDAKDYEALKNLSQQFMQNDFYEIFSPLSGLPEDTIIIDLYQSLDHIIFA